MYTGFFGLKEIPFSIAPNPHYLFMSDRHREALAHLSYGLGETGGFVLLTGEVGTGKTTVSRCLMEQLPENTQAAFILNPTLSSQELLATICDEFKIRYRKTGATLKTLTDKIQEKLLKNHEKGINTLLIIDEAQHLKPEVLEQLRLLTNLETHTKKLLQVILIGQPELQQLLQRRDLRQLAQRITARYHLLPLNRQEVGQYIQHRLNVAECKSSLFNTSAINTIHQLSKGIPRLINLLCDRALLGAYGKNKTIVDKKLVLGASSEALGEEYQQQPWWQKTLLKISFGVMLLAITVFLGFWAGNNQTQPLSQSAVSQSPQVKHQLLTEIINQSRSLPTAVDSLFVAWRITLNEQIEAPCEMANFYDLACYWYKGSLSSLLKLNYPAVFKFADARGEAFYGTLTEINGEKLTFIFNDKPLTITKEELSEYWQGGALVFWQAPKDTRDALNNNITEESDLKLIQWLEHNLSKAQQRPERIVTSFDNTLVNQLTQYQRLHGLSSEQGAEQRTLMSLGNMVAEGLPIFSSKHTVAGEP